jgi:hypothetical protein
MLKAPFIKIKTKITINIISKLIIILEKHIISPNKFILKGAAILEISVKVQNSILKFAIISPPFNKIILREANTSYQYPTKKNIKEEHKPCPHIKIKTL